MGNLEPRHIEKLIRELNMINHYIKNGVSMYAQYGSQYDDRMRMIKEILVANDVELEFSDGEWSQVGAIIIWEI